MKLLGIPLCNGVRRNFATPESRSMQIQSFNPKPEEIATIPAMDGVPLENTCGYGWHNSMYFAAKSAVLI